MYTMETVNKITCDIAENLGKLTRQDVISFDDAMDIMQLLNTRQYSWMQRNFSKSQIDEFTNNFI